MHTDVREPLGKAGEHLRLGWIQFNYHVLVAHTVGKAILDTDNMNTYGYIEDFKNNVPRKDGTLRN